MTDWVGAIDVGLVVGVLAIVEMAKRSTAKLTNRDFGILWWWFAWLAGASAAAVKCPSLEWECLVRSGLVYGGAAIALYPASKRLLAKVGSVAGG